MEPSQTEGLTAAISGMYVGQGSAPRLAESPVIEPRPTAAPEPYREASGSVSETGGSRQ